MFNRKNGIRLGAALSVLLAVNVQAANVRVTVTNHAPAGGTYLTPVWVGFHNGSYDTFDAGSAASAGIEAIAEDGNTAPLSAAFAGNGVDGMVGGAPIGPGGSVSADFTLAEDGSNSYLSFASMLLPSSDFFIGNDNSRAMSLAGVLDGTFSSAEFTVQSVYDAGTEVNDFATSAANGLFGLPGGQNGPNQGADENGLISGASGGDFAAFLSLGGIDVSPFNFDNYAAIATIQIETIPAPVPIPATLPLIASAIGGLGLMRRRRS